MDEDTEGTIVVHVDKELEDLIPGYMANRRRDIIAILSYIAVGDYEPVRVLAHSMKGSGGGYGFDQITEIGARMEVAAKEKDSRGIKGGIAELLAYLDRITVVYE